MSDKYRVFKYVIRTDILGLPVDTTGRFKIFDTPLSIETAVRRISLEVMNKFFYKKTLISVTPIICGVQIKHLKYEL